MAFASNLAAINAANQSLKAAGFSANAAELKAARAKHFKIEKVDGQWHALVIEPLPNAQAQADAIIATQTDNSASAPQAAAPQPEQSSAQALAAASAAAAFFASRVPAGASTGPRGESDPAIAAEEGEEEDSMREQAAEQADFEAAQRAADAQANAQQSASQLRNGKVWIHASTCASPVKRVWAIADAMVKEAAAANRPVPSRKEIQDECVRQGVASGTARTQYQAWKKANENDAANAENAKRLSDALNGKAHS